MVISDDVWRLLVLKNSPPVLFRDAGVIVWVERDEYQTLVMRSVTPARLKHHLVRIIQFIRMEGKDGDFSDARPPEDLVADILARPDKAGLPYLRGVTRIPLFGPDGSCHIKPGYDPDTGYFYDPCGAKVPYEVDEDPSCQDVALARENILDVLQDFPFIGEAELAHAVGAMIQPFVRPMITGPTPLYLIEKPTSGTGGTLLAHVLCHPALGEFPTAVTQPKDEGEWRRSSLSWLRDHPQVILIDNLGGPLRSETLASILTSGTFKDRVVGTSDTLTCLVDPLWIATGNNPILSAEIARRTIRIRIDAKSEFPDEGRQFKYPDIRAEVAEMRPHLIWSILTLVKAWIAAGKPTGRVLGGFDNWSRIIGGILQVAGIDGFLANRGEQRQVSDGESSQYGPMVLAWANTYGVQKTSTNDLWTIAGSMGDIDLGNGPDHSRRTRLGRLLASLRDRHICGYRIETSGLVHSVQTYRLVKVDEPVGGSEK